MFFNDPAIRLLSFLRSSGNGLGTPDFSPACLLFFRELPESALGTPDFSPACNLSSLRVLCVLRANPVFWERRTLVRQVFSFSGRTLSLASFPLCSPCPLCELLFKTCQLKSWRSQAFPRIFPLCSPCSQCEPSFFAPSRKEEALTPR